MLDRLLSGLMAGSLAFLVWMYARTREQELLDNVPVPVQLALASRDAAFYELEVPTPTQVMASFTGPPSRIRELRGLLRRGELSVTATIEAPQAERFQDGKFSDALRVRSDDVHPPPGVRCHVVEGGNRVPFTLHRLVERPLPVRLEHGLGDRLASYSIEPATVLVRGPQAIVDRAGAVPTRPFTLTQKAFGESLRETVHRGTAEVLTELDGRSVRVEPAAVGVKVTLRPKRQQFEARVPVAFLTPPEYAWRPQWIGPPEKAGVVTLKLLGPTGEEPPPIKAFVDLTCCPFDADGDLSGTEYAGETLRLQLPKDFQLAQPPPVAEPFRLVPVDPKPDLHE